MRTTKKKTMPRKPLMTFMRVCFCGCKKSHNRFPMGTSDTTHFFLAWHIDPRYPLKKNALW